MTVCVGVDVEVSVGVDVAVADGSGVAVCVGVDVDVSVGVAVTVSVGGGVADGSRVPVSVGRGVAEDSGLRGTRASGDSFMSTGEGVAPMAPCGPESGEGEDAAVPAAPSMEPGVAGAGRADVVGTPEGKRRTFGSLLPSPIWPTSTPSSTLASRVASARRRMGRFNRVAPTPCGAPGAPQSSLAPMREW
ncbi:MAG: hypothetical protein IT335_13770 [Thermomicrobiales bacterium]|nr:hypothetical protein [Thermomicrobiales bacterium]